jgi:hypothetical protein
MRDAPLPPGLGVWLRQRPLANSVERPGAGGLPPEPRR